MVMESGEKAFLKEAISKRGFFGSGGMASSALSIAIFEQDTFLYLISKQSVLISGQQPILKISSFQPFRSPLPYFFSCSYENIIDPFQHSHDRKQYVFSISEIQAKKIKKTNRIFSHLILSNMIQNGNEAFSHKPTLHDAILKSIAIQPAVALADLSLNVFVKGV